MIPRALVVLGVAGGCARFALPEPTPAAVEAARPIVPEVTLESLTAGRTLVVHRCSACHASPRPTRADFAEWPDILREMGPKARITPEERHLILQYLQAMSVAPPG